MFDIRNGDCLEILKTLPDNSVDSVVTDPPAGINFMGLKFDSDLGGRDHWIAWMESVMDECYRVLKPGAHGFVWSLPRTSHWTATAIENAGFEVREVISHVFSTGFPKSHNISIAIDKLAGKERKITGYQNYTAPDIRGNSYDQSHVGERERLGVPITEPVTEDAKKWDGWGSAIKPAVERWILGRKPYVSPAVDSEIFQLNLLVGDVLCRILPAKYVKRSFMFNPKGCDVEKFDFALWSVSVSDVLKSLEKSDLTGMFNSQEMGEMFLNTVWLWNNILEGFLENGNMYTTETELSLIIELKTLRFFLSGIIQGGIIPDEISLNGNKSNASIVKELLNVGQVKLSYIQALTAIENVGKKVDTPSQLEENRQKVGNENVTVLLSEDCILARKPLEKKFSIAENVLKWGVGGINIDASRIHSGPSVGGDRSGKTALDHFEGGYVNHRNSIDRSMAKGRFPANFILSHSPDCKQIGEKTVKGDSRLGGEGSRPSGFVDTGAGNGDGKPCGRLYGDEHVPVWECIEGCPVKELDKQSGNRASRFFYCAKPSTAERNFGCEDLPTQTVRTGCAGDMPIDDQGKDRDRFSKEAKNIHPTVKSLSLMSYLIKMVTPPSGTVLDMFLGSGSTGIAAIQNGFNFIGIEKEPEYFEIAKARISKAAEVMQNTQPELLF